MLQSLDDTIIALSTPSGPSLRTILRISGSNAFHSLNSIFIQELPNNTSKKRDTPPAHFRSAADIIEKTPTFRSIDGYIALRNEEAFIPVTLYIMKTPRSFTKEDVVEIHTIGSVHITEMILSEILSNNERIVSDKTKGCSCDNKQHDDRIGETTFKNKTNPTIRLAEPGEFTKRAFLNGRIDLTQAEAVMKVIRSNSDSEILAGISLLKGEIRFLVDSLRNQIIDLCGQIEASIDFSDQDISLIPHEEIKDRLHLIHNELLNLGSGKKSQREVNTEGINVMIYGRPNVGKSSLLNAFGPSIKTIVSDSPHTTRDSIKRTIKINNIFFNFFDNPGIDIDIENSESRNCFTEPDNINSKAMSKSKEALNYADVVIFVLDSSRGLTDTDKTLYGKLKEKRVIIVINKCDLLQKINLGELGNNVNVSSIIKTSTITREGIDNLKKELTDLVLKGQIDKSGSHVTMNTRQNLALASATNFIKYALNTTKEEESLEFIALDLRNALDALGEIVGHVLTDDILDKIFSEFCLGK